jgi:hypothetical protein
MPDDYPDDERQRILIRAIGWIDDQCNLNASKNYRTRERVLEAESRHIRTGLRKILKELEDHDLTEAPERGISLLGP